MNGPTTNQTDSSLNIRATKRKLDNAFQVLDDAVGSTDTLERPSPAKRTSTIRSLYSTLTKYGIRSKESQDPPATSEVSCRAFSKNTPHLTAILTRAATRTRKALPLKFSSFSPSPAPALPPTAEYRPSSIPAFLSRLSTFKLATYANKPPAVDAVAASKCGWTNGGKDRLVCGLCTSSWVVAGREGMSRDAANALIEKQRVSLVDMHKNGCPWKIQQCDPTIYRIPLQSPSVMLRDLKSNAIVLEHSLRNVEVRHPLATNQLNSLRATIAAFALHPPAETRDSGHDNSNISRPSSIEALELSDTAILTALFGWVLVPSEPRRVSLSRANSLAPSSPPTPSLSRSASVTHEQPRMSPTVPSTPFTFRMPLNVSKEKHHPTLLQCPLCQRRVGLWAFTSPPSENGTTHEQPQAPAPHPGDAASPPATPAPPPPARKSLPKRQFDLLREHRSYCPYVVRSTLVPSLPSPLSNNPVYGHNRSSSTSSQLNGQIGNGAVEGWRAVLTVLLRYGKGQRQRMGLDYLGGSPDIQENGEGTPMEVDGVKAMVAGVKSRGGKDLLRYVKSLLS